MSADPPPEAGISRRELFQTSAAAAGLLAMGPEFWQALARPARVGPGPYGPLQPPDANGLMLPAGFTSRVVARGLLPVSGTLYLWHIFSDGAATYRTGDGGWILVSNSEVPTPIDLPIDPPVGNPGEGGASAIRFGPGGEIVDAYRILSGTSSNCAGGATPWGTWLSCEETETGQVWECDPTGERDAVARPAMGAFTHEAVCIDRRTGFAYLSEDEAEGCFYRFRPRRKRDLSDGVLEAARVRKDRSVKWLPVPDPAAASTQTREQVKGATRFQRGEGVWFDSGTVYLATTRDSRIWAYDARRERMRVLYDPQRISNPPLTDVDNITVHERSGDLYVCEDNGAPDAYDIAIITPERGRRRRGRRRPPRVARFLKLTGLQHGDPGSELSPRSPAPASTRGEIGSTSPRSERLEWASSTR